MEMPLVLRLGLKSVRDVRFGRFFPPPAPCVVPRREQLPLSLRFFCASCLFWLRVFALSAFSGIVFPLCNFKTT